MLNMTPTRIRLALVFTDKVIRVEQLLNNYRGSKCNMK